MCAESSNQASFFAGACRAPLHGDASTCLLVMREASLTHRCAIHAYVLMTNHVHLLATPMEAHGVSRMMQQLGRRYIGGFRAYRFEASRGRRARANRSSFCRRRKMAGP
jgi:REP element-mobilizing transposase RayT